MVANYTLHLGDCLEVMPGIPAGSVDAIIADWPYGTTACKWDSVIPLEPLWKECKRVIKPKGAIVLTASQPFTTFLISSSPYFGTKKQWFKYELIWYKINGTSIFNAKRRPLKSHENILLFSNSSDSPYFPQMTKAKKENMRDRVKNGFKGSLEGVYGARKPYTSKNVESLRYPTTVFCYSNQNAELHKDKRLHPTQKPVALMEYLIKTYTNPDDLVLDNTMGSGSTGEACLRTDRRFIGIEKDPGYFEIAQTRLNRVEQELREAQIARERQPYLVAEVFNG